MSDNFGLKIGIEGEKEFKNALRDINQSFKVLGSEMKLASSEFDKNDKSIVAVTARNQVLNKAIEAQKDKISTLEAALRNASESFGENDRRTQNWAIQLNNAKAELNGMERELEETAEDADNLGEELKESGISADNAGGKFEKLGGILKGIGVATEMMEFIENHANQSLDYDEELVRLLVEKVTIFESNVVVRFKSGIEVEV